MRVQTYTVKHTDDGLIGVVVGLLERIVATTTAGDALAMLIDGEPVGHRLYAQNCDLGNHVALGPTQAS